MGILLAVSLLFVSKALNFGLPFFDGESNVGRTKNTSLENDTDKTDDNKNDKPNSSSNPQGVQKISICHSAGDSKFVLIEVDDDSTKQGHSGHELATHGRYYHTRSGQELPRPGVADVRALRAQVVAWMSMLGFSPSMRSEIGAAVQADNALTKFRNRRPNHAQGKNTLVMYET